MQSWDWSTWLTRQMLKWHTWKTLTWWSENLSRGGYIYHPVLVMPSYAPVLGMEDEVSLRLMGLIPSVQAQRLHRIAQSLDETMREIAWEEERELEKLWITAGGDKDKIPSIWDPRLPIMMPRELGGEEPLSEWEISAPKKIFPRPCN